MAPPISRYYAYSKNNIALGLVPGVTLFEKYGKNIDVDAAEDIWGGGGTYTGQPTGAAETMEIASSDAADDAGLATLTLTGTMKDAETVTIGTKVYTFEEILTNVDGNVFIEPDATADETLTLTENAADTNTVTIGTHVYTFQTALTDTADNVLIGALATDSIDNLIAAINGDAGAGTLYGTGTAINLDVTAAVGAGDTMDATAILAGTVGNLVVTTDTLAGASAWGAINLTGGTNDVSVTIDNLINAINLGAGAGTDYATLMTANASDLLGVAAVGAGDTLTLHAGSAVATTETADNASWGAANAVAGTGAWTVVISNLLDENFEIAPDITLALGGIINMSLGALTYTRCTRVTVETAGSGGGNAGALTLRHTSTTANIFATMAIGLNQTQIGAYTVPKGHTLVMDALQITQAISAGVSGSANLALRSRRQGQVYQAPLSPTVTHSSPYNMRGVLVMTQKTDFKVRAEVVSAGNQLISTEMSGMLVDNTSIAATKLDLRVND